MMHPDPQPSLLADANLSKEARALAQQLRRWSNSLTPSSHAQESLQLADMLDRWANHHHSILHQPTSHTPDADQPLANQNSSRPSVQAPLPSVAALLGKPAPRRRVPSPPTVTIPSKIRPSRLISEPASLSIPNVTNQPLPQPPRDITPTETPLPWQRETSVNPPPIVSPPPTDRRPRSTTSGFSKPVESGASARAAEFVRPHRTTSHADISMPSRWWNIPVVLVLVVGIAVTMGGLGVEIIRIAYQQSVLARTMRDPKSSSDEIIAQARSLRSSPLNRWDAHRELIVAHATLLASQRQGTSLSANDKASLHDNVRYLFRRARDRSPASPWHQVNLALGTKEPDAAPLWEAIAHSGTRDAAIIEQLALHQIERSTNMADKQAGLAQMQSIMKTDADRTGPIVTALLAAGLSPTEILKWVPHHPRSYRSILDLMDSQAVIGLRRAVEEQLTHSADHATNQDAATADDDAAWGEIEMRLERWDRARAFIEKALQRQPDRPRWKLLLAEIGAAQNNWDQARRLLAELPIRLPSDESLRRESILEKMEKSNPSSIKGSPIQAN
jgi:tetratricopeptide (TPR) repeat protein